MARGKGEGTIYERGTGFCGQITLPDRSRKTVYGKSKKEVRQKLAEVKALFDQGQLPSAKGKTLVRDHLQTWLETEAKGNVSYHTYEAYEIGVRRRLIPGLGHLQLKELRTEHIQKLYAELNQGLAPKSIRQTHVALNQALKLAVDWGYIPFNPADKVRLPKLRVKDKTILKPEEVARFLAATRTHRLNALWHLLVTTGLRKGEALGLKWTDVDWDAGTLSVRRQIIRKTGEGLVLEGLKTESSKRTIQLGSRTLEALKEHRKRQLTERLAAPTWEDRPEYEDLIFTTNKGKPGDPATTWATFQRALKQAGLPRMTLHALRDTAATNMLASGTDAKTISERLGHSDVALTLRVYSHVTPQMQKTAAEKLDDLYEAAAMEAEAVSQ